jgi:hypothetical protein
MECRESDVLLPFEIAPVGEHAYGGRLGKDRSQRQSGRRRRRLGLTLELLHAGQVILQPLSSSGPAASAPFTTEATLNRSSGADPLASASPTNSEARS